MRVTSSGIRLAWFGATLIACTGLAQAGAIEAVPAREAQSRDGAIARMLKPVRVDFRDVRLEDLVSFLSEFTGVDIQAMWQDEQNESGLAKDRRISFKSDGLSALNVVERILRQTSSDEIGDGSTWQLSEIGEFQIGPRSRLNRERWLEVYDISDLVMIVPTFTNAPQIDLQSALQSTGTGGSSIFSDIGQQQGPQSALGVGTPSREQRVAAIAALLRDLIEPEQWADKGGDGATLRELQGSLLVNAPDYIHRQIAGYVRHR
jgi:hypothetical protein